MPLNPADIGRMLAPVEVDLTPRMALAFSAGIGEAVDIGKRASRASPFHCVSMEWRLRIHNGMSHLGLDERETARIVHAGQSSSFHKPMRTGRKYRVEGQVADIRATRAGGLIETDVRILDAETGEVAVSTTSTAISRGTLVTSAGGDLDAAPKPAVRIVGMPGAEDVAIFIEPWFAHRYTECADIWNPIHTEIDAARAAGLPGIIVHGSALWALAGAEIAKRFTGSDPERLASLSGRFSAMVQPGETVTLRCRRTAPARIDFELINESGRAAISHGIALLET